MQHILGRTLGYCLCLLALAVMVQATSDTVTPTATMHGMLRPNTTQTVTAGGRVTVIAPPKTGLATAGAAWADGGPSVTLTSPVAGALFAAPASIALTATASASAGATVSKVDYYNGATLLGTATTAPYGITWAHIDSGGYALTAVVTDSAGLAATSAAVNITTAPLKGLSLSADQDSPQATGTPITLTAQVTGAFQNAALEYKFVVETIADDDTKAYTTLQDYSSANTCLWTPTDSGMYYLWVYARQVGDSGRANRASANLSYSIYPSTPTPLGPHHMVQTLTSYQPDLQIRNASDSYIGVGIYDTDGSNQTKSQTITSGSALYYVHVYNAGTVTDSFTLTAPAAPTGWTVAYTNYATGADITSAMTGSGWSTGAVAPGAYVVIFLTVTPTTFSVSTLNTLLTATSATSSSQQDAVLAVTTPQVVYQPDLQIHYNGDSGYIGAGIYNTTGANQTKSQTITSGSAIYNVRIYNAGNVTDSFTLTAPAAPTGWTVKYTNYATGADITSAMTGSGWPTGSVAPGAYVVIFLTITPTTFSASTLNTLLTATSAASSSQQDAVLAVTTPQVVYQPDLQIRNLPDLPTSYVGADIINTTGTNQTKSQTITQGSAQYYVRVYNSGNVPDSFFVTAPAAPSGWTVLYTNYGTGANITSAIIGSGWNTGQVAIGAYLVVTVTVTPTYGVGTSGTLNTLITATSVGSSSAQDAVLAVTTVAYIITPSAGANGAISPSTPQTVNSGGSVTFTATPNTGDVVDTWTVDNGNAQTGGTTFTLSNVTNNHTVNVTFKVATFWVTPSAGANGVISPSSAQPVNYGDSVPFTATPNTGYVVDTWTASDGTTQTGGATFTLSNVTVNRTVSVTFKPLTFTVTPSAGANGVISPSTAQTVNYGGSVPFTATPNTGYAVNTWSVDGNTVQTGGSSFTLSNVTNNLTVSVSFNAPCGCRITGCMCPASSDGSDYCGDGQACCCGGGDACQCGLSCDGLPCAIAACACGADNCWCIPSTCGGTACAGATQCSCPLTGSGCTCGKECGGIPPCGGGQACGCGGGVNCKCGASCNGIPLCGGDGGTCLCGGTNCGCIPSACGGTACAGATQCSCPNTTCTCGKVCGGISPCGGGQTCGCAGGVNCKCGVSCDGIPRCGGNICPCGGTNCACVPTSCGGTFCGGGTAPLCSCPVTGCTCGAVCGGNPCGGGQSCACHVTGCACATSCGGLPCGGPQACTCGIPGCGCGLSCGGLPCGGGTVCACGALNCLCRFACGGGACGGSAAVACTCDFKGCTCGTGCGGNPCDGGHACACGGGASCTCAPTCGEVPVCGDDAACACGITSCGCPSRCGGGDSCGGGKACTCHLANCTCKKTCAGGTPCGGSDACRCGASNCHCVTTSCGKTPCGGAKSCACGMTGCGCGSGCEGNPCGRGQPCSCGGYACACGRSCTDQPPCGVATPCSCGLDSCSGIRGCRTGCKGSMPCNGGFACKCLGPNCHCGNSCQRNSPDCGGGTPCTCIESGRNCHCLNTHCGNQNCQNDLNLPCPCKADDPNCQCYTFDLCVASRCSGTTVACSCGVTHCACPHGCALLIPCLGHGMCSCGGTSCTCVRDSCGVVNPCGGAPACECKVSGCNCHPICGGGNACGGAHPCACGLSGCSTCPTTCADVNTCGGGQACGCDLTHCTCPNSCQSSGYPCQGIVHACACHGPACTCAAQCSGSACGGTPCTGAAPASNITLQVYKLIYPNGPVVPANLGEEVADQATVNGTVAVVCQITVAPGEQVDTSMSSLTVRVKDTYGFTDGAVAQGDTLLPLGDVKQWYHLGAGYDGQTPLTPNSGSTAQSYIAIMPWNTRTAPGIAYPNPDGSQTTFTPSMGHNDAHSVSLAAVNTDPTVTALTFDKAGGGGTYPVTPPARLATVKNLVITSVSANPGTVDYLKYDPDPTSANNRPTIAFADDNGPDAQNDLYYCWGMIQPTRSSGKEFLDLGDIYAYAYAYVKGVNPTGNALTWDGSVNQWNATHTAYTQSAPDQADWGTYTYDVVIEEHDEQGNCVDMVAYKWPYCLSLGDHELSMPSDDNGIETLKFKYILSDYADSYGYPNSASPTNIQLTAIDSELNEKTTLSGGSVVGKLYDGTDGDGISIYTLSPNDEPGVWRIIVTGSDNCWRSYKRDHTSTQMLAANKKITSFIYAFYIYQHPSGIGHITLGLSYTYKNVRGIWSFGSWPDDGGTTIGGIPVSVPGLLRVAFTPIAGNQDDVFTCATDDDDPPANVYEYSANLATIIAMKQIIISNFLNADGRQRFFQLWQNPPLTHQKYDFHGTDSKYYVQMTTYEYVLGGQFDCVHFADYVANLQNAQLGEPPDHYQEGLFIKHEEHPERYKYARGKYYSSGVVHNCHCDSCTMTRKILGIQ